MFYEEKIINGVLHSRSDPKSQFTPVVSAYARIANSAISLISDMERKKLLALICHSCGRVRTDYRCHCGADSIPAAELGISKV